MNVIRRADRKCIDVNDIRQMRGGLVHGLVALVLGTASCGSVLAGTPGMSFAEYTAAKRRLSTQLQTAKAACAAETDRREICLVDAMGKDWVAKADLEVAYRSRPRSRAEAGLARVDANFWMARERCDGLAWRDRSACLARAEATRLAGRTDVAVRREAEERDESCASVAAAGDRLGSQACRSALDEARKRARRSAPR